MGDMAWAKQGSAVGKAAGRPTVHVPAESEDAGLALEVAQRIRWVNSPGGAFQSQSVSVRGVMQAGTESADVQRRLVDRDFGVGPPVWGRERFWLTCGRTPFVV